MLRIDIEKKILHVHTHKQLNNVTQELTNPTQASKWKNQKNPGGLD